MKKTMIALMAVLFALSAWSASALTIVRQDGQGGAQTTIAGAIAVEPDGGSIQIQQFSGPFNEGTLGLSWRSLTSTAGKATINFSQYNGLNISNGSVSNLILKGTADHAWQRGLVIYGNVTASNIEIYGFDTRGISLEVPAGSTANLDHIVVGGVGYHGEGTVAIQYTGAINIDHCTFVGNPTIGGGEFANIYLYANNDGLNPTYTASNVSIKNSIISGGDRSIGAYYLANLALVHKWNDLIPDWDLIKYNSDASNLALDATEKNRVDPMFLDPANCNYQISASSPLVGQGENGSTIGAFTPAGPQTRVIRQDAQGGAYTTIAAALAASNDGDTLSIQQFSGAFTESSTVALGGRTLTSTTTPKPTINLTGTYGMSVVGGQVKNVILAGNNSGWQNGLTITGSALVDNCELTKFCNRAMAINIAAGQSCMVTNNYIYGNAVTDSCIGIDNKGTVTINHNTIVLSTDCDCISISVNDASYNASNITIKNNILKGGAVGISAYYLPNFALAHSYNDFGNNWWHYMYYNGVGTLTVPALGTGEVLVSDPLFRAPALNNYTLSPMSYMCGRGESGGNIGADTVTVRNTAAPGYNDTLVAVDGKGRVLPGYATCGAKKTGRYIGLFFEPWLGPGMSYGPYDQSAILAAQGWNPVWPGNAGDFFHWGKPEMGYYYTNNEYIIRQQAQMLCDAGVDVIIIDFTNGYDYKDNYFTICQVFQTIRDAGGTTPQVAPFINNAACAQLVYNDLYAAGKYSNLWFQWDGKPLMLSRDWYGSYSTALRNFFTFRQSWAWTRTRYCYNGWFTSNTTGKFKWPFADDYPANFGWKTVSTKMESIPVEVAQGPNELSWPFYNGIGRSYNTTGFNQGPGQPSPGNPGPLTTTGDGIYFALNWNRALSVTSLETNALIFVGGWNSWVTQKFVATDTTHKLLGNTVPVGATYFSDAYSQEFSGDIEPMEGGHTDNYYYQMIDGIRRWKGVSADSVSNAPKTITIDGSFADWDAVTPVYRDYVSDAWQRNTKDWNGLTYNNNTGRNDFTVLKVTNDANNVYFYAECLDNISPYTDANWMWLLVNKDNTWTNGWNGYDYMVNYGVTNSTQTTLKSSTSGWNWTTGSSTISYRVSGNKMEIAIPRTSLGLPASGALDFSFKWADNAQATGDIIQFSTNGDSAPNRRFAYHYKSNS